MRRFLRSLPANTGARTLDRSWLLVSVLLVVPASTSAQEPDTASRSQQALPVFLDCQTGGCDFDFFRTEIPYVDWVRVREVAAVHLLITSNRTVGAGRRYTLAFIGRDAYEGEGFELEYFHDPTDTNDDRRRGLARSMSGGLLRFVADTPLLAQIEVRYLADEAEPGTATAATPEDDPWNFWVFTANLNSWLQGQSTSTSTNFWTSLNANRTTDEWKVGLSMSGNYSEDSFELTDRTSKTLSRGYGANARAVYSLSDQWSAGARVAGWHSTFNNHRLATRGAPGVEYNFFPYDQVTRRSLTLQYSVGVNYYDYIEETIYERSEETVFDQAFQARIDLNQPWGSVSSFVQTSTHLTDLSRNRTTLFGNVEVRIFRGFSFDVTGRYSRIRDLINLPAGGATDDEVLLRRQQIDTSFDYWVAFGVRFTFGSAFNNVVNPRFDPWSGFLFF